MATYVLIHGAGGSGWVWHRVAPALEARGHEVLAPDLPCEDDAPGFPDSAEAVVGAIGPREEVVLVAHSMAGFVARLVAARAEVGTIVLRAAMVPRPGERAADWVGGHRAARGPARGRRSGRSRAGRGSELGALLARPGARTRGGGGRAQSGTPFARPLPLAEWPGLPTRSLAFADDRLLPAELLRRVAADRLGIATEVLPGGHMGMLSRQEPLAARLAAEAGWGSDGLSPGRSFRAPPRRRAWSAGA